jgi:hypothetical protein
VHLGRADGFLRDQFLLNVNLVAAPVWLTGLYVFARSRRYRMLAWMYAVPLLLFLVAKGRFYYVSGAYPMLLAMGAVVAENRMRSLRPLHARGLVALVFIGVLGMGGYAALRIVPIASSGPLRDYALRHNGDLREEIGWPELVAQVAAIRDSLPAAEQANLGIAVGNYGDYGAIALLGPAYYLPVPVTTINSGWLRGYPEPAPSTYIVLGNSLTRAEERLTKCRVAGHSSNTLGIVNEESRDHPDILICGPSRVPLDELWRHAPEFG